MTKIVKIVVVANIVINVILLKFYSTTIIKYEPRPNDLNWLPKSTHKDGNDPIIDCGLKYKWIINNE